MTIRLSLTGHPPHRAEELRPLIGIPVQRQMKLLRDTVTPEAAAIADRYYREFHRLVDRGVRLYPRVRGTLQALRGRPVATMSTRPRGQARHHLRGPGL